MSGEVNVSEPALISDPVGWLLCKIRELDVDARAELFHALDTLYTRHMTYPRSSVEVREEYIDESSDSFRRNGGW